MVDMGVKAAVAGAAMVEAMTAAEGAAATLALAALAMMGAGSGGGQATINQKVAEWRSLLWQQGQP